MLNDLDRSHIVILRQQTEERRLPARAHTLANGDDDPEIRDWAWPH